MSITITTGLAIAQVVLTIYDNYNNAKHRKEYRELEKEVLKGELSSSLDSYKKLCQLKKELQQELFDERINNSRKLLFENFKATANHESERSKEYPLRIPSFALVDNIILKETPNLLNDFNSSIDKDYSNSNYLNSIGFIKPLKVIITPILNKENYNTIRFNKSNTPIETHLLNLMQELNESLDDFFCDFYNCVNYHQVILFSDIWTNISIKPIYTEFVQLQSFLHNEPTVIVNPLFDADSNTISFKIYYWGITNDKAVQELVINDLCTFSVNLEDSIIKCVEEWSPLIKDAICFICDSYMWYQYQAVPYYPSILKEENRLNPELIDFYKNLLLNSINNCVISPLVDIEIALKYAQTIDTLFAENKCMFSLLDLNNNLCNSDYVSNNNSLIESSMGAGIFLYGLFKFVDSLLKSEENKNQVEKNNNDVEKNNSSENLDRFNKIISLVNKTAVISPQYNLIIYNFFNNSNYYNLRNKDIHNLYLNCVESLIQVNAYSFFQDYREKYQMIYHQDIYKNIASYFSVFFHENLDYFVSLFANTKDFVEELNKMEKKSHQRKLNSRKIEEICKKIKSKIIIFFEKENFNKIVLKGRKDFFRITIKNRFPHPFEDNTIIDPNEFTALIPNLKTGVSLSQTEYIEEKTKIDKFYDTLFSYMSESELDDITEHIVDKLLANYKSYNFKDIEYIFDDFDEDTNSIIKFFCQAIIDKFVIKIDETYFGVPVTYAHNTDLNDSDKQNVSELFEGLFSIIITSSSVSALYVKYSSRDVFTKDYNRSTHLEENDLHYIYNKS